MHDVIIVGGGSAGSALAGRLSEDAGRSVLLIEAGVAPASREEWPADSLEGTNRTMYAPDHPLSWSHRVELLPGRPWVMPYGRLLGGSSAINGCYFIRGLPEDYDAWAAQGNDLWGFEQVLPSFRRLESDHDYSGPLHGDSGPMPIRRAHGELVSPLTEPFISAFEDLGHAAEHDMNAGGPPGVGLVPSNSVDGLRFNAAFGYVLPNLDRPNLTVRGDTLVRRVVFEGQRAVGVEVDGAAGIEFLPAREVVLSAGAFKSAHLLLLSGVGPADHLRAHGITVVHDSPGVGTDWFDHPSIFVPFTPTGDLGFDARMVLPQAALHFDSGSDAAGDVELLLFVAPMFGADGAVMVALQQGESRGTLRLASADPHVRPEIRYNYLSTGHDRARMRDGVRRIHELYRHPRFAPLVAAADRPGSDVLEDDAQLDAYIKGNLSTTAHASGTARMGRPDQDGAVVDQWLRVHGVDGLRVVDNSIMPTLLHRGPAATAIMIGERAAELIQGS
jgi:choline dehydrogenase